MTDRRRYDPRMGDEDSDADPDSAPSPARSPPPTMRGQSRNVHAPKHVRLDTPSPLTMDNSSEKREIVSKENKKPREKRGGTAILEKLAKLSPFDFSWIPKNLAWPKLKPVIRCALVAWVSLLFVVIPKTEDAMGQASFLIMIAAFLDPPSDPFLAVVERELLFVTFVTAAWAWSCLGIFLATLARHHLDYDASLTNVITGAYVEAAPTVIMAVFIFLGITGILFVRARAGPGPFLIPSVFACICIDLSLTTAVLFPYPYYLIGKVIVLPLALHAAISIVLAALVFPSTITAQYTQALGRVLDPLAGALAAHRTILHTQASDPTFPPAAAALAAQLGASEAALAPTAGVLRLVKHDFVWGRFAPADVAGLQWWVRRLVTRAHGMGIFFTLIEPTRERFPITPAPSRPTSPASTRANSPAPSRPPSRPPSPPISRQTSPETSRPASPTGERGTFFGGGGSNGGTATPRSVQARLLERTASAQTSPVQTTRRRPRPLSQDSRLHLTLRQTLSKQLAHLRHGHRHTEERAEETHDRHLHFSLLSLAHALSPTHGGHHAHFPHTNTRESTVAETAVGVFESQRYLALEASRLARDTPDETDRFVTLLGDSCDTLLGVCEEAVKGVRAWVGEVRRGSWAFGAKRREKLERERAERVKNLERLREGVTKELEKFRKEMRHQVLDPYRSAFDPKHVGSPGGTFEPPPHRYLFHCYFYQFHLIQFGLVISDLLKEIVRLENEHKRAKLWLPSLPVQKLLIWSRWDAAPDNQPITEDEDPNVIQGIQPEWAPDLGTASRRDPDALPPSNWFERVMHWIYDGIMGLTGGNALYAMKAGLLTIILCIPSFLRSSAGFAYSERFSWGIFMGQLTLARFRGDTTFALVARVIATFMGGTVGMLIWYISAGSGHGSYYGLPAVCAVCFPLFFFGRLYWNGPAMTNTIFFVTAALVFGYSWQDTHMTLPFHYYGWDLAWRRFVLVTAGVTSAFIFSFLPPSFTLRRYQRTMLATTIEELGSVYCSIVSFANTHGRHEVDKGEINQSLLATRMKLKRSMVLKTNIVYEFSLRGRWPAQRYQKILELQLQISYLLSHLMSVVEHLEPAWSRAFLRRTRFLDSDFQGDVLAVISMISTSLRTGNPLPQITPCPLLDRFMIYTHGLNVIRQEADDDYGLPRTIAIDTLENEQYLCFSVGVTTAFGIIVRLDKLMVATKELVGEQFHIHGVGLTHVKFEQHDTSSIRPAKDA